MRRGEEHRAAHDVEAESDENAGLVRPAANDAGGGDGQQEVAAVEG